MHLLKCKQGSPLTLSAVPITKVRKLLGVITFLAILRIRRVIQADKAHIEAPMLEKAGEITRLGDLQSIRVLWVPPWGYPNILHSKHLLDSCPLANIITFHLMADELKQVTNKKGANPPVPFIKKQHGDARNRNWNSNHVDCKIERQLMPEHPVSQPSSYKRANAFFICGKLSLIRHMLSPF